MHGTKSAHNHTERVIFFARAVSLIPRVNFCSPVKLLMMLISTAPYDI